jgi:hypothetical protein
MADERFSEEEYAVLVRLFGPNYNPEEPVIPMESSEACHCCPHDKLI